MEKVSINLVKPGAVLASPATDVRGHVLVGAGMVLSEEWIQRLKARGVRDVLVVPSGASAQESVDATLKKFDAMFAKAPQTELMTALASAARSIISQRKV